MLMTPCMMHVYSVLHCVHISNYSASVQRAGAVRYAFIGTYLYRLCMYVHLRFCNRYTRNAACRALLPPDCCLLLVRRCARCVYFPNRIFPLLFISLLLLCDYLLTVPLIFVSYSWKLLKFLNRVGDELLLA